MLEAIDQGAHAEDQLAGQDPGQSPARNMAEAATKASQPIARQRSTESRFGASIQKSLRRMPHSASSQTALSNLPAPMMYTHRNSAHGRPTP